MNSRTKVIRGERKDKKPNLIYKRKQKESRGSRYRGVSTNNNSWQVLVKVNGKMRYIGSIQEEADAARIYDKVIIQYQGDVAKTNFNYTQAEVLQFLRSQPLIKG